MIIVRLKAFFAFLIFFVVFSSVIYFSLQSLIGYFTFRDVIIYTWMDCFALIFSFVVLLISIYPGYVAFCGVQLPPEKSKIVYKAMIVFFVSSLIVPIAFSFVYVNTMESKGYIQCRGVPLGWMPGTSTKYATSESLCFKKDP